MSRRVAFPSIMSLFQNSIARSMPVLINFPELVFPQLFNRLQWHTDEISDLKEVLYGAVAAYDKPWFKLLTKLNESSILIRSIKDPSDQPPKACFMSADGKEIITISEFVRCWNVESGEEIWNRKAPFIAFSSDRKLIAVSGKTETNILDARTGRVLRTIPADSSIKISRNLETILYESKDVMKIVNTKTGDVLTEFPSPAHSLAGYDLSPDGAMVFLSNMDCSFRVLDANTGELIRTIDNFYGNIIYDFVFSPKGEYFASPVRDGDGKLNMVDLWDIDSGDRINSFGMTESFANDDSDIVRAFAFRPDRLGLVIATKDRTLKTWDADSGYQTVALHSHAKEIHYCTYSPSGRYILSIGDENTAKIWSKETEKAVAILKGHTNRINGCDFSPDERYVVSVSDDMTIRIWDLSGKQDSDTSLQRIDGISAMAISPDNHSMILGYANASLELNDAETMEKKYALTGHPTRIIDCEFSGDGQRVISCSDDGMVRIWNARNGESIAILNVNGDKILRCHCDRNAAKVVGLMSGGSVIAWDIEVGCVLSTITVQHSPVYDICLSADGKRMVTVHSDYSLGIWDIETGNEIGRLPGHSQRINSCAVSPCMNLIVTASDDTYLKLWDIEQMREVATLRGHRFEVNDGTFSPDGKSIISASGDLSLKVWSAESGKLIMSLYGHTLWVNRCAFSPDGAQIASVAGDGTIRIWDAKSGKELAVLSGFDGHGVKICFHLKSRRIYLLSQDPINGPNTKSALYVWKQEKAGLPGHSDSISACSFSPDGYFFASASSDGSLRVWDAHLGRIAAVLKGHEVEDHSGYVAHVRMESHTDEVTSCTFSPDSKMILSGSKDGTMILWDSASGEETAVFEGPSRGIRACAISPDGQRVVSIHEYNFIFWDLHSRSVIRKEQLPREFAFATSLDSRFIATASDNTKIKLWDIASGGHIEWRTGHSDVVAGCAFNSSGKLLATYSEDKTIRIWQIQSQKLASVLQGHRDIISTCAFSPDGRYMVSSSFDNETKIWDLFSNKEKASYTDNEHVLCQRGYRYWQGQREYTWHRVYNFTNDGQFILSSGLDRITRIWRTDNGEIVSRLVGVTGLVNVLAISPDGTRIVLGDAAGQVVWLKIENIWKSN